MESDYHSLGYVFQIERYAKIAKYFIDKLNLYASRDWQNPKKEDFTTNPRKYLIEGYSMGSKGLVFNIAENAAVLKYKLHEFGIHPEEVPPTTVKKFATGKGNANKDKMYEAFLARGNPDLVPYFFDKRPKSIGSPIADIVDSYFIALWGATGNAPK